MADNIRDRKPGFGIVSFLGTVLMRITAFYSQLGEISVLVHSKLEFHSLSRLGHMTELRETKRRYRRAYAAALQAGLEVKRVRPLQRKGDISKKTMFEFFHNCVAVIRAVGAGPKRGAGGEGSECT